VEMIRLGSLLNAESVMVRSKKREDWQWWEERKKEKKRRKSERQNVFNFFF
jgi:hypothetical protein